MEPRINYDKPSSVPFRAMLGLEKSLANASVGKPLLDLIRLRISQINSCAYCIDMHWKDARAAGESEQRLYGLSAWRESPYYTERERAALAWAEEITRIAEAPVSDETFEKLRAQFNEHEIVELTWAAAAINTWNRVNVALRTPAGGYQPPKKGGESQ